MSRILPKEKQTAYQRWELASFDEAPPVVQEAVSPRAPDVRQEMEQLKESARQEGFQKGFEEGKQQGHQEGLAQGIQEGIEKGTKEGLAKAADEVAQFKRISSRFQEDIAKANELIAQDILNVSLDLAKAMLKTALKIRPELILPIVSETVHYLPSVQPPASLFLNPADIQIVKQFMGDELTKTGWRIMEDPHLDRGGCRVETSSNQIDATVPTRWQRITAALDKTDEWLES